MISAKSFRNRYILVYIAIAVLFLLTFYRLFCLQVVRPEKHVELAKRQHNIKISLPPKRGYILDAKGNELATSLKVPSVYAVSRLIYDKEKMARELSAILDMSYSDVLKKLRKNRSFVWIDRNISEEAAQKIKAMKNVNINILHENRRFYPHGSLASHILGFCDIDNKGLEGIEVTYDKYLSGRKGYRVTQRDARGRRLIAKEEEYVPPVHGYNIKLTIDQYLQHIVEKELDAAYTKWNAKSGVALVMDCHSGKILAIANRPTFDLNKYYEANVSSRRNRAITDCYEPGSVFKIVTAAAALEEGLYDLDDTIFCENGEYRFRPGRILHDTHEYGELDFTSVVTKSSNIGTVKMAEKLGENRLYHYIRKFGFGELSGVDLPGEISGLFRPTEQWSKISISSIPMGQEVAVTPLQLVAAISAIANGGNLITPFVVQGVYDAKGVPIEEHFPMVRHALMSEDVAEKMRVILQKTVDEGTGRRAAIEGIPVAGKTGTAQKSRKDGRGYAPGEYMSSFLGFVPADDPMLSIIVMLDTPRPSYYGGTVSAPAFKRIAEQALNYLGYARDDEKEEDELTD